MDEYRNETKKYEIDISKYRNIGKIDNGLVCNVFKVKNKSSGEYYAAKVCNINKEYDNLVYREIYILITTKQETIIKFIGFSLTDFEGNNNITIIMEFAEKGSLKKLLDELQGSRGPDDFDDTNKQIIITGIAYGLKYLHSKEIIHRDVKPGNVLLDKNYYPKITDFNLSKKINLEDRKDQSNVYGTHNYMAPEIFSKDGYEKPVDVYAFGILVWEVATYKEPYRELREKKMTNHNIIEKVIEGYRPPLDDYISNPLKELITKCWDQDPEERPTFDDIFYTLTEKNGDDYKCAFDGIDDAIFDAYITKITNVDDELLDTNITVTQFNLQNLELKGKILRKILDEFDEKNIKKEKFFEKVSNFIKYLSKFSCLKNLECIKLEAENINNNLTDEYKECRVQICSEVIENFFLKKKDFDEYLEKLNDFEKLRIVLKSQINNIEFNQIFDCK